MLITSSIVVARLRNESGRLVLLTKPNGATAGGADIRSTATSAAAPIKPTPTAGLEQLRRQYTKFIANNFITKTCLTTFTYLTNIHVQDGKTSYESHEQVIRNVATERYVAPEGLAAATDKFLLDFHSTIIEPSETFNAQQQTEIQSTIFAVERTPDLSVATQYTTYSYRNEILANQNANEVAESNDVQVQISATESVKVIKNLVTVPYFEGSAEDYPEPSRTTEATTILNTYIRPLQNSMTLRQIVKTVINNQPEADLEDEIDSSPVETTIPTTTTSNAAIIENFKKLAPVVLNAMADLLQKFPGNVKQKAVEKPDEILAEESNNLPSTFKKPIYIPVNSDNGDLQASASTNGGIAFNPDQNSGSSSISAQQDTATSESEVKLQILDHNHFLPPNIGNPNLDLNEHEVQVLSNHKNELHLMDLKLQGNSHYQDTSANSGVGIPISPGEIINTNSDVIIGRPSAGNKPRLPNSVNSIPLQAHIHHHHHNHHVHTQHQQQQQQFHNNQQHQLAAQSSTKEEIYHGPPPPPPQQIQPLVLAPERKPIPLKIHPGAHRDSASTPNLSFNVPPNRPPVSQSFHPERPSQPSHGPQTYNHGYNSPASSGNQKLHPEGSPPIHFYQKPSDHLIKPQYINRPPNPPPYNHGPPHHGPNHNQQVQHHQQSHNHHHHQNQLKNTQHHNQGHPHLAHPEASITVADGGYYGNDILEIKPIPEVYSTDLPPVLVQSSSQQNNQLHAQINLQPSQVTNIIIPSRNDFGIASVNSGSATNFGSSNANGNVVDTKGQKFTYGKYFSEPSPYQGQDKLEFYANKPQLVVVDNGKAKEVRPKNEPNPSFIQFQPNAANEISVQASPIQFQGTTAVDSSHNNFDDLEITHGSRDEPILVSTSNRISSVSTLDGKTQIKVSEQQDDRDTQDIVVQNHFNFNANVRDSATTAATTTTTTARPFRESESSGNFRQHLGPFGFNGQHLSNQSPSFATNQVLINNQASIDVQLSSQIGSNNPPSQPQIGQVLAVNVGNNEVLEHTPAIRNQHAPQRPHKGERFNHHHHPAHHHQQIPNQRQQLPQQRPNAPIPLLPTHQQLPSEVKVHTFNKRPQTPPPTDNYDRMTSKGPIVHSQTFNEGPRQPQPLNPQQSQVSGSQQQINQLPNRPVSTDHYNHQSYGQSPPPPPTEAPPPPPTQPPKFQMQPSPYWNGAPAKPNNNPGTPYPFDKGTPPPMKRMPPSPIQGPSTLQSQVKQQQEIQSGVNDSINEIAGIHLSIMTPPPPAPVAIPIETTTTTAGPLIIRHRPDIRSPVIGDHHGGHVNLRVQSSPQSINNEFHQLIKDGQSFADNYAAPSATAAPQQVDIQSFTPSSTTPAVTVDSQTEYNGLREMSKYHHIERKPPAHPPSQHHQTSMKISRVPQRPQLPPQRNSTFTSTQQKSEGGNNGDVGGNLPPNTNNLKTNSRGTSKFHYNLSHKPYQFQQRHRPTTLAPTIATTIMPSSSPAPSTISSVRLRLPHKGVPFKMNPAMTSTPMDDQMAMDLTPPPVRPIELSYGQGFQKPSKFDGGDTTASPQNINSVYQTIKRPIRPTVEVEVESNATTTITTEKPMSYWDTHREPAVRPQYPEETVRNRGPPPTTALPEEDSYLPTSSPSVPRRTSIHDRRIYSTTTQGPYEFETAEPDIITVPNGKDDSVFMKASFGPPYAFERPDIILTKKPEKETPVGELLGTQAKDIKTSSGEHRRPDLVLFQAPRTNPTTTTTQAPQTTEGTTLEVTEETTTSTTEYPSTTSSTTEEVTTSPSTTNEPETSETEATDYTTDSPSTTTKGYVKPVRLRPKLSLSTTTTTRKPYSNLRSNNTFVKPGDRPRLPFLKPSISVVQLNSIAPPTSTSTEGPSNKTDSIFVVMRPANQQPVIPHQHRPSLVITRKPEIKRPIDFHTVTRDEDDAFHTNSDSRLVIAGVHHIQDNGFPDDVKKFGGKVSSNGDSGNIYIHPDETGHSASEDPSESASATGSAEPSPDDYVVCEPGCNAAKNEKCVLFSDPGMEMQDGAVVKYTKCACRPGFGRMFPDRPCKPTYTYTVNLKLNRYGSKQLIYDDTLTDPSSKKFEFLRQLTKDSLDRMLMQSDVRDNYHGIKSIQFHPIRKTHRNIEKNRDASTFENMEIYENGLMSEFTLQLSENTEAERLSEILLRQVRKNGYKIGNTDLTTFPVSVGIINPSPLLNVTDFDECESEQDHDCSKNALCYNLKGTYTCSCKENYADASDMPSVYPGRKCTNDKIGCATCNYNGRCVPEGGCECYRWYLGPTCQFNLKVILYATLLAFILLLVFLFLLFFCILLKRKNRDPRHKFQQQMLHGILSKPAMSQASFPRRTVPEDEQDEVSSDATNSTAASQQQLRAVRPAPKGPSQYEKRRNPVFYYQQPTATQKSNRSIKSQTQESIVVRKSGQDQMQVMIPRAKFHSQSDLSMSLKKEKESVILAQQAKEKRKMAHDKQSIATSVYSSQIEAKLLSYLDASAAAPERKKSDQKKPAPYQSTGALVSAGFEVSATVGPGRSSMKGERFSENTLKKMDMGDIEEDDLMLLNDSISVKAANRRYDESDANQDAASDWFRDDDHDRDCHLNQHNSTTYRTVSEARSYGETMIQPATKTLRSHMTSHTGAGDEANTMAERDIGSTFLLPHTHLYKPTTDRGSDISGFDSI